MLRKNMLLEIKITYLKKKKENYFILAQVKHYLVYLDVLK